MLYSITVYSIMSTPPQVVAMVSTLALQLQRARAHEWNELIQARPGHLSTF